MGVFLSVRNRSSAAIQPQFSLLIPPCCARFTKFLTLQTHIYLGVYFESVLQESLTLAGHQSDDDPAFQHVQQATAYRREA
jgi:hypothetical protein